MIWTALLITILVNLIIPFNESINAASDYWPADDWRTSTPEKQGIDSGKLRRMLEYIKEHQIDIHSILIIRNGYLVLESYMAPYDKDTIHNLKSVSKSFLSAVAGIALREKLLTGLD